MIIIEETIIVTEETGMCVLSANAQAMYVFLPFMCVIRGTQLASSSSTEIVPTEIEAEAGHENPRGGVEMLTLETTTPTPTIMAERQNTTRPVTTAPTPHPTPRQPPSQAPPQPLPLPQQITIPLAPALGLRRKNPFRWNNYSNNAKLKKIKPIVQSS